MMTNLKKWLLLSLVVGVTAIATGCSFIKDPVIGKDGTPLSS